MCASQQPLNGADSVEQPQPWMVTIVDRHDPDARPRKLVLSAYGRNDLRNQVDDLGCVLLAAEAA